MECACTALLAGSVTAFALKEFVFAGIILAAAAGLGIFSFIYEKKRRAPPLTEEEKSDAGLMKKYDYAKSSLTTLRVIFYIFSAAAGVMLAALCFARYMIILFAAPVFITSVTMLIVNRAMFAGVDVTAKPKEFKEPDDKDGKDKKDTGL